MTWKRGYTTMAAPHRGALRRHRFDEWCMRPEEDADILYWCSGFAEKLLTLLASWHVAAAWEWNLFCVFLDPPWWNHEVDDYNS